MSRRHTLSRPRRAREALRRWGRLVFGLVLVIVLAGSAWVTFHQAVLTRHEASVQACRNAAFADSLDRRTAATDQLIDALLRSNGTIRRADGFDAAKPARDQLERDLAAVRANREQADRTTDIEARCDTQP